MKIQGITPRVFVAVLVGGGMLFAGLTGTRASPSNQIIPPAIATVDPNPPPTDEPPVAGDSSSSESDSVTSAPPPPTVQEVWAGDPNNPTYDGRINATMADRYAVYCVDGELQVWDGVLNSKVAGIFLTEVAAMPSGTNRTIGDGVALGRSNDVLTVVGPGDFVKDGISFADCTAG